MKPGPSHRSLRAGRPRRQPVRPHRGGSAAKGSEPMTVNINISIPISYTAPLPLPPPSTFSSRNGDDRLELLFREHAERWKKDTQHWSSATKMIMHPSYLRIMGMGPNALSLILSELKERPDHWFVALNGITGEDPGPENCTFDEAVKAWVEWGVQRGYSK